MKNWNTLFNALLVMCLFGFAACSGNVSSETEEEKKAIMEQVEKVDAIGAEMDKATEIIKAETEEMKEEVDSLLNGI